MKRDGAPATLSPRQGRSSPEGRSVAVVKRAAYKVAFFTVAAAGQALLGYAFVSALGSLFVLTSLLSVIFGLMNREEVGSPYWTFFDEGAWFALLGHALLSFR